MKRREGRQKCCLLFMLFFCMFLTFCTLRCCLRCECDDVCTLASTHTQRYKWHPWSNLYHIRYHHFLFWICGVERDGNGLGWWALPASIHAYILYIYVDDISICSRRKALTLSTYLCASSLCCCRSCFHSRTLTWTHMHGDYLHAHRWYVNPLSFRNQAHLVSSRMALERTYFATQLSNVGIVYGIEFDTRYLQYTHTLSTPICNIVCVCSVRERLTVWIVTQQQQQQAQNRKKSREIMYIIFIYAYTKSCTEPPRGIFYIFEI